MALPLVHDLGHQLSMREGDVKAEYILYEEEVSVKLSKKIR